MTFTITNQEVILVALGVLIGYKCGAWIKVQLDGIKKAISSVLAPKA